MATPTESSGSTGDVPDPTAGGKKVMGPASYFPSIERTYGHPIQHWIDLARARLEQEPHMAVVSWLKSEHGMGHGHANAVVAYVRAGTR